MKLKPLILGLCVLFVLGSMNVEALAEETEPEVFTCNALVTTTRASGSTTRFTIHIDQYTSDEDTLKYFELLKEEGQAELRKVLEKVTTGWIAPRGQTREVFNFTRSIDVEGGRTINILKTRYLRMIEFKTSSRSRDYDMTFIQLKIDENGEGEGYMFAGTKVEVNEEGQLVLEQRGTAPIKLSQVKLQK